MKKTYFLLASVLAIYVWWLWSSSPKMSKPVPATATVKTKPIIKPNLKVSKSLPTVSEGAVAKVEEVEIELNTNTPEPAPPPRGSVEFRVLEDQLAVAFGDVVMGKVRGSDQIKQGLTAAAKTKLWPSNLIPFSIDERVANKAAVGEAIQYMNQNTSIKLIPWGGEPDSIVFYPSSKLCASYLGRSGGHQPIYLSIDCGRHEVLHEIMHALGFVHEHSRVDRDRFIEVLWRQIDPQYWFQFWIVPDDFVHNYSGSVFDFDPESIMLYEPTAFAITPGERTLKSKSARELRPSRGHLSRLDQERLFYLYGQ